MIPVMFDKKSKAGHYLFVKEHNVRESHVTKPRDRTLFVLNVPPHCNEVCGGVRLCVPVHVSFGNPETF